MNEYSEQIVPALQATIADQKRAIEALQEAIAAREQTAATLQTTADERKRRIDALQTRITEQELTIATLRTALGKHDHTATDVTALRQQFEDQQQEAAYKLALALTLANCAYDALMVVNEKYEIIAINTGAEALFGRQHPIGESLLDVTGSPEIEMMVQDALIYQEESFEEQISLNRRLYRVRAQVVPRDGNLFIGLAFEDVTELVRLNRARRDMVANISHELRTPIANIRLIIDSLFHEQDKPKRKQSTSALRAIARETDSLLWLVQELLDLSMIESGQAILRMVEVPADMLVEEAFERLLDQSDTKELKLVRSVPEGMMVLCDRDQARRVLINLIHNAIKWSPVGETITVEVTPGEDEVMFAVLDNGPGVPDDHRDRIFERFYQVDASRSAGEGTGLGLAICKHIVEAHGGRIWAEGNSGGGGGRFLFTLPSAETAAAAATDAAMSDEQ